MNKDKTKLENKIRALIKQHQLPVNFYEEMVPWYQQLAESLSSRVIINKPLLVSLNGSQGSGKSTLVEFVKLILIEDFGISTLSFSLDDFYLSKNIRKKLASEIHPLLATRGVPGTHDIGLLKHVLHNLLSHKPCLIPQFDKAKDDLKLKSEWLTVNDNYSVILFEGWCNHVPVQTEDELVIDINELEQELDVNKVWRHYVNEHLELYHQSVFSLADVVVYLQTPSFEKVFEWRSLQEQKLKSKKPIDVAHFIQHYERLTRQAMKTLPTLADIVVSIGDEHQITAIK